MNRDRFSEIFTKAAGRVTNIVLLGFFSLVCSLPVVTIGASSTALNMATKAYLLEDEPKPLKFYFRIFKEKFALSTKVWLLNLVIYAVCILDFIYYRVGNETMDIIGQTVILVLLMITLFETSVCFVVIGEEMEDRVGKVFSRSIDFSFNTFFRSLCIVILSLAIPVISFFIFPGCLMVFPGIIAYLCWHFYPKMMVEYKYKRGNAEYRRSRRS